MSLSHEEHNALQNMTTCPDRLKQLMTGEIWECDVVDFGSGEAKIFSRDKNEKVTDQKYGGEEYKRWLNSLIDEMKTHSTIVHNMFYCVSTHFFVNHLPNNCAVSFECTVAE